MRAVPSRIFTELGILHVGPVPNPLAESCNTVGCPFVESVKAKFPGVFSGVFSGIFISWDTRGSDLLTFRPSGIDVTLFK